MRRQCSSGKRVLGECFLDRRFHELGGLGQPQAGQLLDHVAEDIAVPMYDTPSPSRLREELGGAFGKPHAGVGDDQPDALEATFFEVLEKVAPAGFVLLGTFADAENLPVTLAIAE
jgi:catechol 2,3-dioxygenase-like lactoylglutathione lyase family enzyme